LRSYGHVDARLLDGGLRAWIAAGGALESGDVLPAPANPHYPVPEHLNGLIDRAQLLNEIDAGAAVLDARAAIEYTGAQPHARRPGQIPGAINVPYRGLLDGSGHFLPPAELRELLAARGVDLQRPIVAYCNGGVSATVVAHAVEIASGRRPVVYDGSWNEWG